MKCQNCGQHEATFHYRANINGEMMEQHLCPECAANMEGSVFAQAGEQSMFQSMAGSLFGENGFFGEMPGALMGDFWAAPAWGMPRVADQSTVHAQQAPSVDRGPEIPVDAGEDVKKRRKINALHKEKENAIKTENFERAAELRDELYRLENS